MGEAIMMRTIGEAGGGAAVPPIVISTTNVTWSPKTITATFDVSELNLASTLNSYNPFCVTAMMNCTVESEAMIGTETRYICSAASAAFYWDGSSFMTNANGSNYSVTGLIMMHYGDPSSSLTRGAPTKVDQSPVATLSSDRNTLTVSMGLDTLYGSGSVLSAVPDGSMCAFLMTTLME